MDELMTRKEILDTMGITRAGLFKMIKEGNFPAPTGNQHSQVWDREAALNAIHHFNTKVSDSGYAKMQEAWDSIRYMTKEEFGAADIAGDFHQNRCVILRMLHVLGMVEPVRKLGRSQLYRKTEFFDSLIIRNPFVEQE